MATPSLRQWETNVERQSRETHLIQMMPMIPATSFSPVLFFCICNVTVELARLALALFNLLSLSVKECSALQVVTPNKMVTESGHYNVTLFLSCLVFMIGSTLWPCSCSCVETLVILRAKFHTVSNLLSVLKTVIVMLGLGLGLGLAKVSVALPKWVWPENENTANLKSASIVVIMLLHERLTWVHLQKKSRLNCLRVLL